MGCIGSDISWSGGALSDKFMSAVSPDLVGRNFAISPLSMGQVEGLATKHGVKGLTIGCGKTF